MSVHDHQTADRHPLITVTLNIPRDTISRLRPVAARRDASIGRLLIDVIDALATDPRRIDEVIDGPTPDESPPPGARRPGRPRSPG